MSFFSEYRDVNKLLQQKHPIVFYAESRHYLQYFEPLISELRRDTPVCYITSDKKDPLLTNAPQGIQVIYAKWMLGFLFSRIRAHTMIMTMPDLDNFLFKRSKEVDRYIYIFHAAVSTHQQYRKQAFFHYDTIFCTGEYQVQEIRKAEELYAQPPKELLPYGYPLFDSIQKKQAIPNPTPVILIAPSWFEGCIFDTCLEELLKELSVLPYHIILRSHPEYEKRKKKEFKKITQMITGFSNISIDDQPNVMDRLAAADFLITDRSGIAFEFAIGRGRPVLFIDTVLKQTNPDWKELGIEPIENSLRDELGVRISPKSMNEIPAAIQQLENKSISFKERMEELRKRMFFNSYEKGLEYIKKS